MLLKRSLIIWIGLSVGLSAALSWALPGEATSSSWQLIFLPGETTHGHYQIELKCSACHDAWMGMKKDACEDCHQKELDASRDTHPKSKFDDPTKKGLLKKIDAQTCVTCHAEHEPERTHPMGVSVPLDYCVYCHEDIGNDRPSHEGMSFSSCATAGCHNYHDNTALYEKFLYDHRDEPDFRETMSVLTRDSAINTGERLEAEQQNGPPGSERETGVIKDWSETAHAAAGVNCQDCHLVETDGKSKGEPAVFDWSDQWSMKACEKCHASEVTSFGMGKHGMRLASGLSAMSPKMARLPMKSHALHAELSCVSCHQGHRFDTKQAAVDACLNCHNDEHSLAYLSSSHYDAWKEELAGQRGFGEGVSCATCHMPRFKNDEGVVEVEHNQNGNLEPNEKMIRSVCFNCHGLGLTLDSLASVDAIKDCFSKKPQSHIESIDMAVARLKSKLDARARRVGQPTTKSP